MKILTLTAADGSFYQREFPDEARLIYHSEGYPAFVAETGENNWMDPENNVYIGRDYALLSFRQDARILEKVGKNNRLNLTVWAIQNLVDELDRVSPDITNSAKDRDYLRDVLATMRTMLTNLSQKGPDLPEKTGDAPEGTQGPDWE